MGVVDPNLPGPQPPPWFFAPVAQRKTPKWPFVVGGLLLVLVVGALASPDDSSEPSNETQTQDDQDEDEPSRFKEKVLNTSVVNPATP